MSDAVPAWSGSAAIDQFICGISAGVAGTLTMQPLDLLKLRYQISTDSSERRRIWTSLRNIVKVDGYSGLYRGIGVNLLGNCSSWGLYFYWYSILKEKLRKNTASHELNAGQHLLASGTAGVASALCTNPIWVIRTRIFASRSSDPTAYRNTLDGLRRTISSEGVRGLWKGTPMAVVGVSNGALQFMAYEELKKRARTRKVKRGMSQDEARDLSNLEYIAMSGSAKLFAMSLTYPYQVIRARQQMLSLPDATGVTRPDAGRRSVKQVVASIYRHEGLKAFYKGIGPNAVRIIPGTCITFLTYENVSALLRHTAEARDPHPQKDNV